MKRELNFYIFIVKSLILLLFPCLCFSQNDFTAAAAKADILAQNFLTTNDVPGLSISISYNDTIVYSKGFGLANIEQKLPVVPSQSQFKIGSITKTITAIALAKLVNAGKLNLDKSIYFYLDSLPKKEYDFTLRQIGGHVVGLKRMYLPYNTDSLHKVSHQELYNSFTGSLLFKPLTQYSYSNFGFELLGMAIEKASGMPFDEAAQNFVLKPLKMTATSVVPNTDSNTKYYTVSKNKEKIKSQYITYNVNTAPGYYYATSEDLLKLGNGLLFTDRVLDKKMLLELIKPQKLTSGKSTRYGIGIEAFTDRNGNWSYGHSGRIYGGTSYLAISPNFKLVIAITVNCDYLKEGKIDALAYNITEPYIKIISKK